MKQFIKKNFAVILAFLLPLLLIFVVLLSAYLPNFFLSTNYNFIYIVCSDGTNYYRYGCGDYIEKLYSVSNGKLILNQVDPYHDSDKDGTPDIKENYYVRIFMHNTERNESREITFDEATTLNLNSLLTSPDGVTITSNYDRGPEFLFFDAGSSYGHYLIKGNLKKKMNIINEDDRYYYRNGFRFIGWVLPGRN